MTRNIGPEDRVVRIVVALGLGALVYFVEMGDVAKIVAGVVALYLLLTALIARDPLYPLAGVDTSVQEQPYSSTDDRSGV